MFETRKVKYEVATKSCKSIHASKWLAAAPEIGRCGVVSNSAMQCTDLRGRCKGSTGSTPRIQRFVRNVWHALREERQRKQQHESDPKEVESDTDDLKTC